MRKKLYFGEYLSQGALKIEGKCQIVSAQAMIDRGLYKLQPEFKKYADWEHVEKPPWVMPVCDLREGLSTIKSPETSKEKLQVAIDISQLFEQCWRLPVVANLVAILPEQIEDDAIIQAFREPPFTGSLTLPRSTT